MCGAFRFIPFIRTLFASGGSFGGFKVAPRVFTVMCEVSTSESERIELKEYSQNPPLLLSAKGSAALEALHSIVRGQSQVVP